MQDHPKRPFMFRLLSTKFSGIKIYLHTISPRLKPWARAYFVVWGLLRQPVDTFSVPPSRAGTSPVSKSYSYQRFYFGC